MYTLQPKSLPFKVQHCLWVLNFTHHAHKFVLQQTETRSFQAAGVSQVWSPFGPLSIIAESLRRPKGSYKQEEPGIIWDLKSEDPAKYPIPGGEVWKDSPGGGLYGADA